MLNGRSKNKSQICTKIKWFKENWNFKYKPRIADKNKANLQQHKDLQSCSRKPKIIPRYFF